MPTIRFQLKDSSLLGFRISLANREGEYLSPRDASVGFRIPKQAWYYAKEKMAFEIPAGTYAYVASSGYEHSMLHDEIEVKEDTDITLEFQPLGFDDGWIVGDGHTHVLEDGIVPECYEPMAEIEGVDFIGLQVWGYYTGHNRVANPEAGVIEKSKLKISCDQEIEMHSPWGPWEDTTVMGLKEIISEQRGEREYVMNHEFYQAAREQGCDMIVYQSPIWAQFPVDVLMGHVDSVNLADNFFSVTRHDNGPWTYTYLDADNPFQQDPHGIALWIYDHYYTALNTGFALPVSGGSATPGGGGGGPLGMSRFYIEHAGDKNDYQSILSSWRAGKTFASNGPLMNARVSGHSPGLEPRLDNALHQAKLEVHSNRPITLLQWVGDGEVIAEKAIDPGRATTSIQWECELDLNDKQWVCARCFGQSERKLMDFGNQVSPPFITAHTSPYLTRNFGQESETKAKARTRWTKHVNWMIDVVEKRVTAPFHDAGFEIPELKAHEKERVLSILNEVLGKLAPHS